MQSTDQSRRVSPFDTSLYSIPKAELITTLPSKERFHALMRHVRGSMRRNALCSDLEPGARRGGAADRLAGGVAMHMPQPQPHTHNSIYTNLSSIACPHHLIGSPSNSAIILSKTGTIDPQRIRAQPRLDPPQSHQNRLRLLLK